MHERHYSMLDRVVREFDTALRTVFGRPLPTSRPNPSDHVMEQPLSLTEKNHSAGLMRVNHAGEVSAQALYQGQALTAQSPNVRSAMHLSAQEENDHLLWCEQRLMELNSHVSTLNPVWYVGSFTMGCLAGVVGDQWSLGFVAETEHQVGRHLEKHLNKLPAQDRRSRAILLQMQEDEAHHATVAIEHGAKNLPDIVKKSMRLMSRVMTSLSYWV